MGLISWIKGVYERMFKEKAKEMFFVEPVASKGMNSAINAWILAYRNAPLWVDEKAEIKTIGFAKTICEEAARLTTLAIGVHITGSPRARYLQEQLNKMVYPRLRTWVEYGCAAGTVIFKPSGKGIDVVTPDSFMVTACDSNKNITGVIFQDTYSIGKKYYTKLEYHRLNDNGLYQISTRTFISDTETSIGKLIRIEHTAWAGIAPEVSINKANDGNMLFGVFTIPNANNIDFDSPLGMSLFANAMEELKDLDIAYSRNSEEINDSGVIELLDDALIHQEGKKSKKIKLPRHVHNVLGNGMETFYQQIDRPLKTTERKVGINQQLSFIGFKCGFSEGYFVFDQHTGMITATQVESDDRRTIQLVKDIRDNLQKAVDGTINALSIIADLYDLAPVGSYKVDYDFGDITYNVEEDRARNYQLMIQGIIPKWYYLTKFEGFSEEEAKEIVNAASEGGDKELFKDKEE